MNRTVVGTIAGILCGLFFGSFVQADEDIPSLPLLDTFLNFEESFNKSAERTSQQVLTAPTTESSKEIPKTAAIPKQRYPIFIKKSSDHKRELQAIRARLIEKTEEYLNWYRKARPSPGIDAVEPKHLNLQLLKKYRRPQGKDSSRKEFVIVFDDQFHRHVRQKGFQLQLSKSGHFSMIAYVGIGTFAGLLLLYGTLKLINGRAKHDDHLSTSQISMV